jgi:hypothetical protein
MPAPRLLPGAPEAKKCGSSLSWLQSCHHRGGQRTRIERGRRGRGAVFNFFFQRSEDGSSLRLAPGGHTTTDIEPSALGTEGGGGTERWSTPTECSADPSRLS